ncbi:MAG TPA: class I SAM-dependent methyltransferase [Anaerolineales bacterium]|nr:class I SAM-dependent methyltransferase [Anaerolineales bacterium]
MRLLPRFMRFFFHHFYHSFAWTYDFVAAVVSIGRWDDWIQTVIPYAQGPRILEIGLGSGHLQRRLRDRGLWAVGLDESAQMIRLAKRRLQRMDHQAVSLVRGLAQALPFPEAAFDCVISTFPSEYIFDPNTLRGIYRVLPRGGRFVVLPVAQILGRQLLDRMAAWLFRVTGETPRNMLEVVGQRFIQPLERAGFRVESSQIEIRSSVALILIARKERSTGLG